MLRRTATCAVCRDLEESSVPHAFLAVELLGSTAQGQPDRAFAVAILSRPLGASPHLGLLC